MRLLELLVLWDPVVQSSHLAFLGIRKTISYKGIWKFKRHQKVLKHTSDAIKAGIAYVTEDRKGDGLFLLQDIKSNVSAATFERYFGKGDSQLK